MRLWLIIGIVAAAGAAMQPASATTDKYSVTAEEHAACDGDAEKLCFAAFPDQDKLVSCMRARHSELTPVCLATLKAGLARRHMRPL